MQNHILCACEQHVYTKYTQCEYMNIQLITVNIFLELIESYSVRYSNLVFQHLHLTVPSHQQRWDYKWDTRHLAYWILFRSRDKDFVFCNTYRSTLQYINKSLLSNQNILICRNWLKYFTITLHRFPEEIHNKQFWQNICCIGIWPDPWVIWKYLQTRFCSGGNSRACHHQGTLLLQ